MADPRTPPSARTPSLLNKLGQLLTAHHEDLHEPGELQQRQSDEGEEEETEVGAVHLGALVVCGLRAEERGCLGGVVCRVSWSAWGV